MLVYPNCKINLGLKILRRRDDGFHDLETIFYPLPLYDILEMVPSSDLQIRLSGRSIPGDPSGNLVIRAFQLLKKAFPDLPFVRVHLHKQIPIGGGLGGGSADGACMLRMLDEQFRLGLGSGRLMELAAELGSDCPFFLVNRPCLGRGRGEILEPLPVDLSNYHFLLVHPGIHISTARAFSLCRPNAGGPSLRASITEPVPRWRDTLVNDFEAPLFAEYPILAEIKRELYARGARYAGMTGSGSCLFGIFDKQQPDSKGWGEGWSKGWGESWSKGWCEGCEVISLAGKNEYSGQ